MKPLLSFLLVPLLFTASCKKENIATIQPITSTTEASSETKSSTAAKPSTPTIKGNWRLVLTGGGFTGGPPMPVTYTKKLNLKPDFTYKMIYGTSILTGTYVLSTAIIPYAPGTKQIITFGFTPPSPPTPGMIFTGIPPYRYYHTHDTLVMVPDIGADMQYEVYVKD